MFYFFQSHAETGFKFSHRTPFFHFFSQVISGQQFPKPKGSTAKGDVSVAVVVAENILSYVSAVDCNVLFPGILYR